MEKINPGSNWNLPPLPRQTSRITKLCVELGIDEPLKEKVSTRKEARDIIFSLRKKRDSMRAK